jgi:hypothetical protein
MSKYLKKPTLAVMGVVVAALLCAAPARANFVIQVYDNTSGHVLIGSSTVASSSPSNVLAASDANFFLNLVTGMSNSPGTPALAMLPITDGSQVRVTVAGTVTVEIDVTNTDYTMPAGSPLNLASSAGGSFVAPDAGNSITSTFQSWLGNTNGEFQLTNGTPIQNASATEAAPGLTTPLVYSPGTAVNPGATRTGAFSLTSRTIFTFTSAAGDDVANIAATTAATAPVPIPAPAGLALLLSGLPVLGLGGLLRRRKKA